MNRTVPGRNTITHSDLKRLDSTNRSSLVTSIQLVPSLIPAEVGFFVWFGRRSPRYRLHLGRLAAVAGYESQRTCVAAGPAQLIPGTFLPGMAWVALPTRSTHLLCVFADLHQAYPFF